MSPAPLPPNPALIMQSIENSAGTLEEQKMQAELEKAEAQLQVARLKEALLAKMSKKGDGNQTQYGVAGPNNGPSGQPYM